VWYDGTPILPNSFDVKWDRATVTFGNLSAPVQLWEVADATGLTGIFAKPNGLSLQIVFDPATGKGTWSLSGIPGQASGTVTVQR
jgi:hypothetical protein